MLNTKKETSEDNKKASAKAVDVARASGIFAGCTATMSGGQVFAESANATTSDNTDSGESSATPDQGTSPSITQGEGEDEGRDNDPDHDATVAACRAMHAAGVYYPPDPNQPPVIVSSKPNQSKDRKSCWAAPVKIGSPSNGR